jgi:class 3 adenylate cyclase
MRRDATSEDTVRANAASAEVEKVVLRNAMKGAGSGARRIITVVFADLVGSTALGEREGDALKLGLEPLKLVGVHGAASMG